MNKCRDRIVVIHLCDNQLDNGLLIWPDGPGMAAELDFFAYIFPNDLSKTVPIGIRMWEGEFHGGDIARTKGRFRKPTALELKKIVDGKCPWEVIDDGEPTAPVGKNP